MEKKYPTTRMDFPGEIIDLWHEVTYLRVILGYVLAQLPGSEEIFTDLTDKSRKEAQEVIRKKFPNLKIEYSSKENNQNDEKQKK